MSTKRSFGITAAAVTALAVLAAVPAYAGPPTERPDPGTGPTATLNNDEKAEILFQRDEERLAKGLYQAFAEKWGMSEFSHIATSEQRHFDAMGRIITRYQLEDPSAKAEVGAYANAELQNRYKDWLAKGTTTKEAAIAVGVELEKNDIEGLQQAIDASDNEDLDRVYAHLKSASEHHLKAFEALARGETAAMGQGQGNRAGRGDGQGQGHMGQGRMGQGNGPGAQQHQGDPENCPVR